MTVDYLVQQLQGYSQWRQGVANALRRYYAGVSSLQLDDEVSTDKVRDVLEKLAHDTLSVAFVAEFSRGKSELINAIFFSEYGERVLPSSAGRTTMCPTELLYEETTPPCIRLLPIETRGEPYSTSEYRDRPKAWTTLPLKMNSPREMLEAFRQVSLTKKVTVEEAVRYGLYDETSQDGINSPDARGMVEISRWRHAIINFPHPLLKEGLVIIDTPGLNALGSEPELTLNLIPHAHAVLFILAADTGVTRSDIEVWRSHIGAGPGRMVVLNKIDSMWDELRTPQEIDRQVARQKESVAHTLDVPLESVFPVSAQKGLVGKIQRDAALLERSRLSELERALSHQLIPAKRDIVAAQLAPDIEEMVSAKQALFAIRIRNVVEQLVELKSLRGKNRSMVVHMSKRLALEKKEFDQSLQTLQGTRAVLSRLSAEVFNDLAMSGLKNDVYALNKQIDASAFSAEMSDAMSRFFKRLHARLGTAEQKTEEIVAMMRATYQKFSTEYGLSLKPPAAFSFAPYRNDLAMIEDVCGKHFGTWSLLRMSQKKVMQRFVETGMSGIKKTFVLANREMESWLKVVMVPLEGQVREYKDQLKKRKQSLERMSEVFEDLEERIAALQAAQDDLEEKRHRLVLLEKQLLDALSKEPAQYKAAA